MSLGTCIPGCMCVCSISSYFPCFKIIEKKTNALDLKSTWIKLNVLIKKDNKFVNKFNEKFLIQMTFVFHHKHEEKIITNASNEEWREYFIYFISTERVKVPDRSGE